MGNGTIIMFISQHVNICCWISLTSFACAGPILKNWKIDKVRLKSDCVVTRVYSHTFDDLRLDFTKSLTKPPMIHQLRLFILYVTDSSKPHDDVFLTVLQKSHISLFLPWIQNITGPRVTQPGTNSDLVFSVVSSAIIISFNEKNKYSRSNLLQWTVCCFKTETRWLPSIYNPV